MSNFPDEPPSAWMWSQYRGEAPPDAPSPARADPPGPVTRQSDDPPEKEPPAEAPRHARRSNLPGVAVAFAIIAIGGLTWLYSTRPASTPATSETPAPAGEPAAPPLKSEAPPQAVEQAPTAAPPPAEEAAKPAAEKPAPQKAGPKKRKKTRAPHD